MKQYILVIDTDSYAGNFERQITAYCTGVVGDCGKGEEERKIFLAESEEEFDLEFRNEDGRGRPCKIWWSKDSICNSVAIFFGSKPSKEVVLFVKSRADKYGELNNIKILGIRLLTEETVFQEVSF